MENPINGSFKKYKFHIAFSITVLAMLSLIVPVHNLFIQPTQADPSSNIKKSVDKVASKDPKPKSNTVNDAIKKLTDSAKPKKKADNANTDPKSNTKADNANTDPKSNKVGDTIAGLTGNTKPTTKASTADPQSKIGQLIPPQAKETLTKVFTKLSNKVPIPPAVKYSKVGQILGDLGFN
jgi:hypothetical protein